AAADMRDIAGSKELINQASSFATSPALAPGRAFLLSDAIESLAFAAALGGDLDSINPFLLLIADRQHRLDAILRALDRITAASTVVNLDEMIAMADGLIDATSGQPMSTAGALTKLASVQAKVGQAGAAQKTLERAKEAAGMIAMGRSRF